MWIKEFTKSLPSASTPDSRWGLAGILVGFLLFAPPVFLYFFDKGGVLNISSWVWIMLGIIVSLVWIAVLIVAYLIFRKWWLETRNKIAQENLEK